MSTIRILPENLANQIAAGEVVERPASVVKELVENALDAQATRISVQVEGDGSRLLRIIDNGAGMDQDDVLLCLERHATSKLHRAEELNRIQSLGFRGEAIPSIASVSQLLITSRQSEAELGTQADVRYGKIMKVHDMGCACGTTMEIKNLFGNVPARKKFLKSARTELAHIEETVRNMALMYASIGFTLSVNGKTIFELQPNEDSPEDRFRKAFGGMIPEQLLALDSSGHPLCTKNNFRINGFLLPPDEVYGGAGKLRIFVNKRSVRDRTITHGISEGLQGFLMKGRRAAGAIFVELPAEKVDVNVHPTKQEVRFRQGNQIHDAVRDTVRSSMEAFQGKLHTAYWGESGTEDDAPRIAEREKVLQTGLLKPEDEFASFRYDDEPVQFSEQGGAGNESAAQTESRESRPDVSETRAVPIQSALPKVPEKSIRRTETEAVSERVWNAGAQSDEPSIRYIGQLFDTYLLCQSGQNFIAIDQHAAQERLLYEELLRQYAQKKVPSQVLLFAAMIDLEASDCEILEQHEDEIRQLGLDLQEFGGGSFVIKAVPASLAHLEPFEILRSILDRFADRGESRHAAKRIEDVLADMACKAAIKANHKLTTEETRKLLQALQSAKAFYHCPHGRPVARLFSEDEVKKWFYRG